MKLSNEEEVKSKIVLPFLESLGFQKDELSLERSFNLKLGRFTYRIDTAKQYEMAEPRLDILVTRNGINLFVVEVKSDLIEINLKEIEQATSYARLVHPVAPFAIVTNGQKYQIYNSLTRKEIETEKFEIKERYEVSLPDDLQYEALKHFIGYSKDNVKAFCQNQVKEGMKTLLGSKSEPTKKFIPELHIVRRSLREVFNGFLSSSSTAFAIVGDSGIGKTCSMCAMALDLMENKSAVLFYRGKELVESVDKQIAADFNWEFTSQQSEVQLFRRISELFAEEKVVILIDAIDEWNFQNKVEVLGSFLRRMQGKNIKVVMSCKTGMWEDFLNQNGTPTYLSEVVYETQDQKRGYYLDPLSEKEFYLALNKYREFYEFNGRFEDSVLDECKRNLFLMRVFFEVAQKHGLKNMMLTSVEFFNEYYRKTLDKLGNKEICDSTLKAVAKSLLKMGVESADVDMVRDELGLRPNESLLPELFSQNILEITGNEYSKAITFYFSKLRDYIVSHHVLKLHSMAVDDYGASVDMYKENRVFLDALKFFYPLADLDKKMVIDRELRINAEEYLNLYVHILQNQFPLLKSKFRPFTEADIGFLGQLSIGERILTMYGFRALTSADSERIKFIPVDRKEYRRVSNVAYLHGATQLHMTSSSNGFRQFDIKNEVLTNEIVVQLRDIVKLGQLNESDAPYLLMEKVIAIIAKYQAKHHGINDVRKISKHLPIDFEAIEYALNYQRADRVYHNKLIEKKRKEGIIKEVWNGSTVSYSYSLSKNDIQWIHEQAQEAAKNKTYLKSEISYVEFDKVDGALKEALSRLRSLGLQAITESIVPDWDCVSPPKWIWECYSYDTLVKYVERIYKLFLDEYANIIKTNFPYLANNFELYSHMPAKCFITLEKSIQSVGYGVDIYACRNSEGQGNEVVLCDKSIISFDPKPFTLVYGGNKYSCFSELRTGISQFFNTSIMDYIDFPIRQQLAPLRALVYQQIEHELELVIDKLYEFYGVTRAR